MKTALVIGNGPSLADIPNSFLDKYPTFGANRIYLKYTPTYYSFFDPLWMGNYIDDIIALDCEHKHIDARLADKVPGCHSIKQLGSYQFSITPLEYVFGGYTVTYINLQLAYYYGFDRIGLIGVDHFYAPHGLPETQQMGKDLNHFDPDYYSDGDEWMQPELRLTMPAYKLAKHFYEKNGGEIINITPDSKLDVFEKRDWHDF